MIPLFTAKDVREADNFAINVLQIPSIVLMENAARSIYETIIENFNEDNIQKVGIICGKGNNGGDGFALARHFLINDFDVVIISIANENELKGDALTNFNITKNLIGAYSKSGMFFYESLKTMDNVSDCDLIIDAILGTGAKGNLNEELKEIINYLNQLNSIKVAVDIPTGLNVENASGDVIFKADLTVTLSEFKTGLFYHKGYANCGKIVKGSIGMGDLYYEKIQTNEYLIEPEDAFIGLPEKNISSHKYSNGKVLVIAGSGKYVGAACLTSNAVLRSGAGSCFLAFPKSIKNIALEKLESPVLFPYDDNGSEFLSIKNFNELKEKIDWADAIAVGPGLGREKETIDFIHKLLKETKSKKIVIDADGLFALNNVYKNFDLSNKILTPHHKEFADLINIPIHVLENDILEIGKKFSLENNCYLVLKGAPTIIFNPMGEVFINSSGNVGMAKFGTGDVLTGVIASFVAQSKEIEQTLISAVYLHSLAADLLLNNKTEYGIIPQNIIEEFPNAIKFIINSFI
ncbi:MAG: NAD(P)H-hydrate dehydratase [Melioribacteraceae bacterium]|nr:NAD(P)H-hydrate dehydratase [Melioribacteraceae bacterium]